jgi:hypothetical protein
MHDDELESEEEFTGLMVAAGYLTADEQAKALRHYRDRFPAFVKQGQRAFLNRVAVDLREVIARGEQSPGVVRRELNRVD